MIATLPSCNDFDVIVRQSDDLVYKYRCQKGNDTANSIRYAYYKSLLFSKTTFVDGKREGALFDYFPNGKIRIITIYKDGKANGVNKVFNEDDTLVRRSLYINDRRVLFESTQFNAAKTVGRKNIYMNFNNQGVWAGELYYNISDTSFLGDYRGMFVNIVIDDTVTLFNETLARLYITLPMGIYDPEILVGNFDENLICNDTLYYAKLDSVSNFLYFSFIPKRLYNNFLVGRLSLPDKYTEEDIYFFQGFFVSNPR